MLFYHKLAGISSEHEQYVSKPSLNALRIDNGKETGIESLKEKKQYLTKYENMRYLIAITWHSSCQTPTKLPPGRRPCQVQTCQ